MTESFRRAVKKPKYVCINRSSTDGRSTGWRQMSLVKLTNRWEMIRPHFNLCLYFDSWMTMFDTQLWRSRFQKRDDYKTWNSRYKEQPFVSLLKNSIRNILKYLHQLLNQYIRELLTSARGQHVQWQTCWSLDEVLQPELLKEEKSDDRRKHFPGYQ